MANILPTKFFYPLYDKFEQEFFPLLLKAVDDNYHFEGDSQDKDFFIKSLLSFQMLKDYKAPLLAIKENLSPKTELKVINDIVNANAFVIDYSWAIWTHEKEMGKLAEGLQEKNINFIGTDAEFDEFVLRYLVSIWLIDWQAPLYALLQSTKEGGVNLSQLNEVLSLWDFTGIFPEKRNKDSKK